MRGIAWPVKGTFGLSADGQRAKEAAQDSTRCQLLLPLPLPRPAAAAGPASKNHAPQKTKAALGSGGRTQRVAASKSRNTRKK